jgi:uncharacterized membrane protein YcaP (DUF421 family)
MAPGCTHLHDSSTRYDHERKLLSFLLVCSVCATERVVETGRVDRDALRKEAITELELGSVARERGYERLKDVELIVLETDGHRP